MTKYACFDPETFVVLDWFDTERYNYPKVEHLVEITDQQWQIYARDNIPTWINCEDLSFISMPPPDKFHKLKKGEWIVDTDSILKFISEIKEDIIRRIKSKRDYITTDYIILNGYHFHSDTNSRIQQLSLTKMGAEKQIPLGLMWKTKNNGLIELTNEIAAQFESVTMAHDMRLFANAQRHIAAVETLGDIQAVLDYDYSTGWQP
ncbi:DUF4376 domain-containing protein [Escherichia albertii]|uniref:DUF4376 domain-containing protein n=1 Tax=Escherichia albertii TaxID=208962 RepID=UPI000F68EC30|nr:DUF4376 domain-containing protein [Escherichia albertii]EFO1271081.1 DUF4376 domain-containing protein [Escherichia albertii]MCZ8806104.1 DUF4376 domain-containing protein [Escherichia albertii]MCZ9060279.1 DUF4376 domain-containing protein [Escherichia albertii]